MPYSYKQTLIQIYQTLDCTVKYCTSRTVLVELRLMMSKRVEPATIKNAHPNARAAEFRDEEALAVVREQYAVREVQTAEEHRRAPAREIVNDHPANRHTLKQLS